MKIIAQKEGLYDRELFIESSLKKSFIDGLLLDITITTDGKIVVFSPVISNYTSLGNIQNNTLDELKTDSILLLTEVLEELKNYTKKILLRILPFDSLKITDLNAEKIMNFYKIYVDKIIEVVRPYNYLKIELCSLSHSVIYNLKKTVKTEKVGMIFELENLNFVDVDFYIFPVHSLNDVLIEELLNSKKNVMVELQTCSDIDIVYQHISKSANPKLLNDELFVICHRPTIIHDFIQDYKTKDK